MKKTPLQKLVGRARILFGFCPECNSDAPELDTCPVCESYRSSDFDAEFPPTREMKARWWRRFTMARCTHGRPMEDTDCPECRAMFKGFADSHRNAQDPRR